VVSTVQTFTNTLGALQKSDAIIPLEKITVGSFISGSHTRTKTGSHVDVDNFSVALTVSKKMELSFGRTTFGLFGEYGTGNYDTYSYIPRYGEVFGGGDVDTYGGGLFVKTSIQNTSIEASVRGGGIRNEFALTRDPWLKDPSIHSYETDNAYYGAHVGLTQKFDITDITNIEGYGQYLWTRTTEDDFTTHFGDEVDLDAVDSSRARVGARLNHNLSADKIQIYVGAAAEHEFDGKINGLYAQDPISNAPKLIGTSGFGELGLNITPTESKNITINAEIFGWTGRQEGVGGSAALSLNF
jgi:outer membrane autotransporter protein